MSATELCDVLCPCPQPIIHTYWLCEKGNTPNNDLSSFLTQINPLSKKMAKTRAWKSHRPVTPILQLVRDIWSVER